jgi:hypothetical protein
MSIRRRWAQRTACIRDMRYTYRNVVAESEQKIPPLDLDVDWIIMLKLVLKKQDMRACTGFT